MRKGIIIAVLGAVIAGLILKYFTMIYELFIELLFFIWRIIIWIYIEAIADHNIPGIVIAIMVIFSIFGLASLFFVIRNACGVDSELEFLEYKEDMIDGARWRWTWSGNRIDNLHAFCLYCDAELVAMPSLGETHFICERCNRNRNNRFGDRGWRTIATIPSGDPSYALEAIEREIHRRIRTNNYNKMTEE